ncbi:MAG: hypothetical protein P8Y30_02645, partial [candidate division WOR-3 bacterium]
RIVRVADAYSAEWGELFQIWHPMDTGTPPASIQFQLPTCEIGCMLLCKSKMSGNFFIKNTLIR